jgi:putative transposase
LALELVSKYDKLFFETLNISAMKKLWGRKVSDLGLYSLLKIIEFKASENYRTVSYVDRFFPSSKLCSKCGNIKNKDELKLKDRVYKCECGHEMDRDLNAAINILREGASSLGLGGVRPDFGLAPAA